MEVYIGEETHEGGVEKEEAYGKKGKSDKGIHSGVDWPSRQCIYIGQIVTY